VRRIEKRELPIQAEVSTKKSLIDHISSIKDVRDGFIAGAGALYLMGYIIWSLNAWANGLGLLPAAEGQYFIAGMPMAFFIVLGFVIEAVLTHVATKIALKYANVVKSLEQLGETLFGIVVLLVTCISLTMTKLAPAYETQIGYVVGLSLFTIIVIWAKLCDIVFGEWYRNAYTAIRVTIWLFLLIFGLAIALLEYPQIPRELGGIKMRYARFTLKRQDLPIQGRVALLSPSDYWLPSGVTKPAEDPNPMVQTETLDVLYEGGDSMIVRPHTAHGNGPTYELRRSNIQGIVWYGYEAPKTP